MTHVARAPVATPVAAADEILGSILADRYQIIRKLGEGGMANVYLAEHLAIKKPCAIKVLHAEEAHKETIVDRFLQEARAASVIDHENVVEISDFGRTDEECVFLVMEMLVGEDLADMLDREKRITWARAKPMLLQICSALAAAHEKGIIHRDMKPENVFRLSRRGNDDFIKVLDFGIAKITSESVVGPRALTQTGMIFGTPEYMSPEQAEGRTVDLRTDVYSLGVIMFQLLTGRVPFRGESPTTTLVKHLVDEPPVPSQVAPEAGLSPDIDALILRALKKDPAQRYSDMNDFARAIDALDDHGRSIVAAPALVAAAEVDVARRGSGRTIAIVAVTLALSAAVAIAAYVFTREPPPAPKPPPPPVAEPEPEPPPPPEPVPETVTVIVESAVTAEIRDPESRELLGSTADPEGVILRKGDAPMTLLLTAEGYEDLLVEVTPSADQRSTVTLVKKKRTKGKKGATKTHQNPVGPVDPFHKGGKG
ncbi:MAG: serine/threonine-protein kinase [Nannocystaceae bacterium]